VAADRFINALLSTVRTRMPAKAPLTPRVVELLRKAIEWQALLESGEASIQAAIARQEGITRARVTQAMGMLQLGPEIQEENYPCLLAIIKTQSQRGHCAPI
jgi:hypothetical protein